MWLRQYNMTRWNIARSTVMRRRPLRGFSMVELMVAMTLFAMALGGLFPILIEYSRQIQRLEKCGAQTGRYASSVVGGSITWTFDETDNMYHSPANGNGEDGGFRYTKLPSYKYNQYAYPDQWHLMPADDPWMWKLGAPAVLVPDSPAALAASTGLTHTPYLRPFPYTTAGTMTWILDDSTTALTTCGSYTETSGVWANGPASGGYLATSRRLVAGSGPAWAANWTFTNVQPGWYQVWASWPDPILAPKPDPPNDMAVPSVVYQILDGAGGTISISSSGGINQQNTAYDVTDGGVNWYHLSWGTSSTHPAWVYIPLRDVAANYDGTKTDRNGRSVSIYKGDTIQVRIQVPSTATPGFITADGMKLVPMPKNTIKRSAPLAWTWSYVLGQPVRTVSGTVTVSNSGL